MVFHRLGRRPKLRVTLAKPRFRPRLLREYDDGAASAATRICDAET